MADLNLMPDVRLRKPAYYSRQEIVSALSDFYKFLATLPHIDPSAIDYAPPSGWPEITSESLTKRDIHKSDEAVELLRHLPYIRGEVGERFNWTAPECFACDWRLVGRSGLQELRPLPPATSWLGHNSRGKWQWPEWVVQLTAGRDREEWVILLDTTDGTATRYYSMYYAYEPTYPEGDPRSWRDRCCDETLPIREFLNRWRQKYIDMEWLGIPNEKLSAIRTGWMPFDEKDDEGEDTDGEDDDPWPKGKWADDTMDLVRIYKEHGWPHDFRRDECRRALLEWKRAQPDYVRNIDYD
ncbi:hypothetical protein NKR23_g9972 [Pleurostoma richardsiae]|uniref:Uncharacterized protein n=1 Tax=Pleurostoma richardsiae TaxID=41990 RepID=A0AA38VMD3_9PEZI|nr:hypothetical protein NKR23_g9972 [Pleurostoma richardsiae]